MGGLGGARSPPSNVVAPYNSDVTLDEKLASLPDRPGVYLYRDAKAQVVYVGKARWRGVDPAAHVARERHSWD